MAMVGKSLSYSKKTEQGERERVDALAKYFPISFVSNFPTKQGISRDDYLDALAALWTAERICQGTAKRIPDNVECDPRGLDMAMWY
jgi:predicted RNase H-like nuclease